MGFMDDDDLQNGELRKFLKLETPEKKGGSSEARVRLIDERAPGTFRHWYNNRPYNCPGPKFCPACKVRNAMKDAGNEEYKNLHRMDRRYFANVIVAGEVKIYDFSSTTGQKLQWIEDRFGVVEDPKTKTKEKKYSLSDMDIILVKRRTGERKIDVEYDAMFEAVRAMTDDEKALVENRYDLAELVVPADPEEILKAMKGETLEGKSEKATSDQIAKLNELRGTKYSWTDLINAPGPDNLTSAQAEKIIATLTS